MLTDDEALVLEIMAHDEDMLAIGRWYEVIMDMAAKGYVSKVLDKWHRITCKGRAALEAYERAEWAPVIEGEAVECRP